MTVILTPDPLDLTSLVAAVTVPEHGGIATFLGTTRRETALREVLAISYEAYEELAVAELGRIAEEAEARFGASVALAHRVGRVEVGQPSVIVAASAPHRPAAFAACRFGIDELKARVPLWKQMIYADGAEAWIDGRDRPS
jgi:molybdopterin synthase catalytic subunit